MSVTPLAQAEKDVRIYEKYVGLCSSLLILIPIGGIVFTCVNFGISFVSDTTAATILNSVGHFIENIYTYFLWMAVGGIGLYAVRKAKRKLARVFAFALILASLYMFGRIFPYSFNVAIHSSGVGIFIIPILSLVSSVLSFCACVLSSFVFISSLRVVIVRFGTRSCWIRLPITNHDPRCLKWIHWRLILV
jgi:hypothetical protein